MKAKKLLLSAALMAIAGMAYAQVPIVGNSDPTPPTPASCQEYQWPEVMVPCPEVQIKQKHDHSALPHYQAMGWDTVVTCQYRQIELTCMPYIPVQYFDGRYYVDEIPYNPPDPTFYLGYNPATDVNNPLKKKLAISNDDDWAPDFIDFGSIFPFYFFGQKKTKFLLGDNGILTFAWSQGVTGGGNCPYATTTPLPWTSSVPSSPTCTPTTALMRDAIYGVYEDTYTGYNGAFMSGNQGIYYGVLDDYPCRKIIASWNQIPVFSDSTKRQSYQIVCYEGSNIIEVHVKQRKCCSSTNSGNGLIGIQNATGQPQQQGSVGTPSYYVQTGEPAAYWPVGRNVFTSVITNTSYRFTPQGQTSYMAKWYMLRDGQDSVDLSLTDPDDPNGYVYLPMGADEECPTLTRAFVSPTVPTKYVFELRFLNANGDQYVLCDTVFVGVDTLNDLRIRDAANPAGVDVYNTCATTTAHFRLEYPNTQAASEIRYEVYRISNGEQVQLNPDDVLSIGDENEADGYVYYPIDVNTNNLPQDGYIENKIDSIYIIPSVDFISTCGNSASILLRVTPNYDMTEVYRICQGETFKWAANNQNYTQTTNPDNVFTHLTSVVSGCDSTVRLALTVYNVSHTVDQIVDCKPIRWLNGKTYTHSNTDTYNSDTIVLTNIADCDSVVQLDFSMYPLTAKLKSSLENFDLDHLDVELTDISVGGNSRTWRFPYGAAEQHGATAYWSMPVAMDEATIWLIANSPYGCVDSTSITLPLNKETFWIPNAFTPDNMYGNRLFGSRSTKTMQQEMLIYNRRGELVYKCEGVDCTWDGTDLHGQPSPQGSYVYIIRYTNEFEPAVTKVKKGTVTLIR